MAKQDIPIVNTSDTFQLWLNKTNELVDLMNSEVLTASPTVTGDITLGNATLTGTFTATDLISNNSTTTNSLSTVSIVNKVDPVNFVAFNSPVSITSTQEKLLLLKSSSQKPAINLVNAAEANWNVTLGTITSTTPFVIEREGTLNPQFILTQDGDLILSGKLTATGITATSVTGNASTATKLAAAVNINGVPFDGSGPITINTNNLLSIDPNNSYLIGGSFNGAAARFWSVDAASTNTPNKVVVRDSAGNFSAGTITATLSGNATSLTNMTTSITELNYVRGVTSSIQTQISAINTSITALDTDKAPIASPDFTGTPRAPTAAAGTITRQLATTAFVSAAITAADAPSKTGTGASGTWGISITGNAATATTAGSAGSATTATTAGSVTNGVYTNTDQTITGIKYFQSNVGTRLGATNLSTAPLQAYATGTNAAFMSFHRSNSYAVNMGLDGDNVFRIGGWSALSNRLQLDMSGNMTVAGNVSAYSDERLKTNIKTIDNALDKVSLMRGVYFDKDDKASVGVIAQEMEKILPEVVFDGEYKSVAYGNIVGVLIEAIKELKNEIELLKQKT